MNFPLRNIEQHLDEQSQSRGEELLADQAVQSLREIEKHLWVAQVRDGEVFEVEARISPSRLLAGTCECERFRDIGMCEHLAALLFLLRRQQTEQKNAQKKKKAARKSVKKLTTSIILQNISHEDLLSFVQQYAKTNRNFALALKARFAPQAPTDEGKEKYLQLLDSAIGLARKADRGISIRGSQKIYKVLLEMQHQIDEAIGRQYFADAFYIIQSIIEKITPILKKVEQHKQEIKDQIDHSFRAMQEIIRQQPAPALRAEIWEYCLEESTKLRYRNNELDMRFFRMMASLADEKVKKEQLIEKLSESLYKYEYEGRNPAPVLLLQLQVLESTGQYAAAQQLMDRYLGEPDVLRHALRQAVQKGDHAKVKMLANSSRQRSLPSAVLAEVEDILLLIAERENDRPAIIDLARRRLVQSLEPGYLKVLRGTAGGQWPQYREETVRALRLQPFSRQRDELIAQILADDLCWLPLLQHLEEARSVELLQQFDQILLPTHRPAVYRLYRQLLADYIKHHLGRKPSTRIRMTLQHLHQIAADDLVQELVEEFRKNYPERHTLMEELAVF